MENKLYYVESPDGQVLGPMTMIHILEGIAAGVVFESARICEVGDDRWISISDVAHTREDEDEGEAAIPPPPPLPSMPPPRAGTPERAANPPIGSPHPPAATPEREAYAPAPSSAAEMSAEDLVLDEPPQPPGPAAHAPPAPSVGAGFDAIELDVGGVEPPVTEPEGPEDLAQHVSDTPSMSETSFEVTLDDPSAYASAAPSFEVDEPSAPLEATPPVEPPQPHVTVEKLALLRIDAHSFTSTQQVLDALYDKVSAGGYVIVGDYGLPNSRRAVDRFRAKRGVTEPLGGIDWSGVFWRKQT